MEISNQLFIKLSTVKRDINLMPVHLNWEWLRIRVQEVINYNTIMSVSNTWSIDIYEYIMVEISDALSTMNSIIDTQKVYDNSFRYYIASRHTYKGRISIIQNKFDNIRRKIDNMVLQFIS